MKDELIKVVKALKSILASDASTKFNRKGIKGYTLYVPKDVLWDAFEVVRLAERKLKNEHPDIPFN